MEDTRPERKTEFRTFPYSQQFDFDALPDLFQNKIIYLCKGRLTITDGNFALSPLL